MNREHVIQVGFNIDEDAIVRTMSESLSRKLSDEVERGVRKNFYGDDRGYFEPAIATVVLRDWLKANKEDVIDKTASMLVEKLWRTKAVKDMVKAVGEEVKENM